MIISASRRTDIPALYMDWFMNRVREGYALSSNPMNPRQVKKVSLSPEAVDCFVFWSKNPGPLIERLPELEEYPSYTQYTLNAYGRDIEPRLPPLDARVATFKRLADATNPARVVWRYDPILLSERYTPGFHIEQFSNLCEALRGHTEQVFISYVDFYAKVEKQLRALGVYSPTTGEKRALATRLAAIARGHGLRITCCVDDFDFESIGIECGSCIDGALIERITGLAVSAKRDGAQRPGCRCAQSVDIGAYDCCTHGCCYCYANRSDALIARRFASHDPQSPLLIGESPEGDIIRERTARPAQKSVWSDKEP